MNTLHQYCTNLGGVSKPTMGALINNCANGSMAGDDVLTAAYHGHDLAQVTGIEIAGGPTHFSGGRFH